MEVICLEDKAFYELVDKVYQRLKNEHQIKEPKWITGDEVMKRLHISSKATMQKLRDTGKIRFTTDTPTMLYDLESINKFIEDNANNTF